MTDLYSGATPALQGALRSVLDNVQRRMSEFNPDTASPTEKLLLEDLAVSMEELRILAESMEGQVREAEKERQRTDYLFGTAPYPFLVTDIEGVVVEANRAAAEFFGVPPAEMTGKSLLTFVPLRERREFGANLARVAASPGDAWANWTCTTETAGMARASFRVRLTPHTQPRPTAFWVVRPLDKSRDSNRDSNL